MSVVPLSAALLVPAVSLRGVVHVDLNITLVGVEVVLQLNVVLLGPDVLLIAWCCWSP